MATTVLQAASRASLADAEERLDGYLDGASQDDLGRLGDELFSVTRLLAAEPGLRRHMADSSVPASSRRSLAEQVLAEKLAQPTMDTISELVSARWTRPVDLVEAVEALARRACLGVAEKEDKLEEVEDELFRFGRILDAESRLTTLLADTSAPGDKRVELLDRLLGDKAHHVTKTLVAQTVRAPRGRSIDRAVQELAELAAARRDRYIAHVSTPVALSDEQERRLTETLGRMYDRKMSVQIEHDSDLLGGLVVRVGDEVINGSVASKLARARRELPS